VKSKHTRSKS